MCLSASLCLANASYGALITTQTKYLFFWGNSCGFKKYPQQLDDIYKSNVRFAIGKNVCSWTLGLINVLQMCQHQQLINIAVLCLKPYALCDLYPNAVPVCLLVISRVWHRLFSEYFGGKCTWFFLFEKSKGRNSKCVNVCGLSLGVSVLCM